MKFRWPIKIRQNKISEEAAIISNFIADSETDTYYLFPIFQGKDAEIERLLTHHRLSRQNARGERMTIEEYLEPYLDPAVWPRRASADQTERLRILAAMRIAEFRKSSR